MSIWRYFLYAIKSLSKNKLRTGLSTLGIIMGISSVTIMIAIGDGMRKDMLSSFSIGNDTIQISKKYEGGRGGMGEQKKKEEPKQYKRIIDVLNDENIKKIPRYIGNIDYIGGLKYVHNVFRIIFESKPIYSTVVGINEDYTKEKDLKMKVGRNFSKKDFSLNKKVAILGFNLVKGYQGEKNNPFQKENSVGKTIYLGGYPFIIIGIFDTSKDYNTSYNIIIPSTTSSDIFGQKYFETINIKVKDILKIKQTTNDILYYLLKISGASNPSESKIQSISQAESVKWIEEEIGKQKRFLIAIAGISLLVGGIGIMNIILVSVTERTKEIGIRKALGATKIDIIKQFLTESIVISILGCIIAIGLSIGVIYFMNTHKEFVTQYFGLNSSAVFSSDVLVISSIISLSIGLIAGLFPSIKAAFMKPIDALRYE